ncbi:nicotinamide riboside transporter PnuC [Pseudoxanthomonas winnipegensis]|uniref:Nicotinamide riboside transporter PnuC n=1 Tax=Pseudoxanthomonas winnipegensis TaxID=2480810 RepID=A0A4Q8M3L5_9GAMM|nr:nicotinamide riboside transporter PnuC [Pseudoxanthomonas winnipegensis]RZZ90735.1 nicotinamide riboside transporter PnuC [Pseudoxanthomonas winnipegensis]TAA11123.1 nicotinamide riboside transporter PnuC [Pseudoxanthomonas winnipegensis]TAA18548.1 nicotinamide riboside transporter PnuC [Pseudoxanthomonas winnipegensis]TAA37110.1 nicotinamide riboside transporter PnuC [Pseudoxanthomonas winnipegensis]TAA41592.1 nicotinamide riboside transporter PnuC [Pseudoxanthomonas winnipegensis]
MNIDALEWIGAAVSVAAVWLAARRHMLGWPVGLASVALYALVFVDARLYSDALLQVAFAGFIVYGWRRWKANLDDDGLVRVAALAPGAALRDLGLGALGALLLGFCMHRYTDAALPWLDAALTAFSLVAQWWQGRRHVAAWWLWIVLDLIYVGLYLFKSLEVTAALYLGFVGLAVMGLRQWRRAAQAAPLPAA